MSKPYDYIIFSSTNKKQLIESVVKAHGAGYVCLGGVSVTRSDAGDIIYDQAMERAATGLYRNPMPCTPSL